MGLIMEPINLWDGLRNYADLLSNMEFYVRMLESPRVLIDRNFYQNLITHSNIIQK